VEHCFWVNSKTAVTLCLCLFITASKDRDATWCVGFKCVGSVHHKLWRSLELKISGWLIFQMVLKISFLSDIRTLSLFRCYTQFAEEDEDREEPNKRRSVNYLSSFAYQIQIK
jgi:hypothetical protein